MRHAQTIRFQQLLDPNPGAADQSVEPIDTLGFQTVMIVVGTNNNSAMTEFKLTENDSFATGTYTDIPGSAYGSDAVDIEGTSAPLSSTATNDSMHIFVIDCLERKRYILPEITTSGTGDRTYVLGIGINDSEPNLGSNSDMGTSLANISHVFLL